MDWDSSLSCKSSLIVLMLNWASSLKIFIGDDCQSFSSICCIFSPFYSFHVGFVKWRLVDYAKITDKRTWGWTEAQFYTESFDNFTESLEAFQENFKALETLFCISQESLVWYCNKIGIKLKYPLIWWALLSFLSHFSFLSSSSPHKKLFRTRIS